MRFPKTRYDNNQAHRRGIVNQSKTLFWQYLNAWGKFWKRYECVIPAWRDIMMTVAQRSPDYTTCGVPDASWSTENIPGTSSGNDTNRECDRGLVFEKSIFSEKFGGFENYTCPRVTTMNPNALKIFFGHHCIGLLFDFIPWGIIRDSKSVPK